MTVAFLHYTAPPVVGGVEAVMLAHARIFSQAGVGPVRVIAGQGDPAALPEGVSLVILPEMDSRHPAIAQASRELEQGRVPPAFESLSASLEQALAPALADCSAVIIHNIFTKHFNLPLTAALDRLRGSGGLPGGIAWCHDFTWTSPHSRAKVHPGYPWDLLRTRRPGLRYVTVSEARRRDLAGLLDCPADQIQVIYNGVSPQTLWMLSPQGQALVERLRLLESDLVLLMPVRVTQAKNIELALQVTAAIKRQGLQPRLIVSGPPDPHDLENMVYFQGLQRQRDELGLQAEAHFVFELGEAPDQPLVLDEEQVAELYRASDLMFMPSRREGFGMPVLEAGLVGLPVASSDVPAAGEIGGEDVLLFDPESDPQALAERIAGWMEANPVYRLRRRVRRSYTWEAIFSGDIEPLLEQDDDAERSPQPGTERDAESDAASPDRLLPELQAAGRVWLFLDYDGTLADFAPTPADLLPEAELIDLLDRLSRSPALRVVILSGRKLADLRRLAPLADVFLAGTYGIELQTPDGDLIYALDEAEVRPILEALKPDLERLLAGRKGFYLEDKGWSLAVHARFAEPAEAGDVLEQARRLMQPVSAAGPFKLLDGERFLEIGPRAASKDDTVTFLVERDPWPGAVLVYLGDDDKDEEAFEVVQQRGGAAVRVGPTERPSLARYHLDGPAEARRWLQRLADSLPGES